jgi:cyclopropane fatty-acyl-phospholipid synthase-like methyltransferase
MLNKLKLTIEMVPATSWYNNLRSLMPKEAWDKLRHKVYKDFGYRCGICKSKGRLHCHEIWKFDDKNGIQELKGFIALCTSCHWIKHIGLAGIKADGGELDYDKLVEHFMKVNKCDKSAFTKHREEAVKTFEERSNRSWKLKIGKLEDF